MTQVSNIVLGNSGVDTSIGDQLLSIQNRQQALQRRQQQDNDDMVQYMTRELDFSKFATGTEADPVVNESLNGIYTELSNRIKSNKGESMASIYADLGQKINKLKVYTTGVKTLRDGIRKRVGDFTSDAKDVDGNLLERKAMSKALFDVDPITGQPKLKDEFDTKTDFVGEIVDNTPESVYGESMFWVNDRIKSMQETPLTGKTGVDKNGVKRTMKWTAKLKPFEEVIYDKVTKQPTGVGIKTKIETINGKDTPTLDPDVYNAMFKGTQDELRIIATMRRQAKSKGISVDGKTPEGEIMKRATAYDLLKGFRPQGDFLLENDENEDTWKSKQNAGVTVIKNYMGGDKPKTPAKDPVIVQGYKQLFDAATIAQNDPNRKAKVLTIKDLNSTQQKMIATVLKDAGLEKSINDEIGYFVAKTPDGKLGVYEYSKEGTRKGDVITYKFNPVKENLLTTLDPLDYDMDINTPLGVSSKRGVANQYKNEEGKGGKKISRSDFSKMSIAERQQFLNSGGSYQ